MPELIKLYIRHSAIGFGISAVFVGILLYFDVQGLWGLVSRDPAGPLAVLMLWVLNGIVFAGVQFGYAVMQLGRDEPEEPRGGTPDYLPVRVRSDDRRPRR